MVGAARGRTRRDSTTPQARHSRRWAPPHGFLSFLPWRMGSWQESKEEVKKKGRMQRTDPKAVPCLLLKHVACGGRGHLGRGE